MSRNLMCLCVFILLYLEIATSSTDFVLSVLLITPLGFCLGKKLYQYRLNSIIEKLFSEAQEHSRKSSQEMINQKSTVSELKIFQNKLVSVLKKPQNKNSGRISNHEVDVFLRYLLKNISCEYDGYANDQQSPYLEEIILMHKENCFQKQFCFCNKDFIYEDCSRQEFLGKNIRQKFLNDFIMKEYTKRMDERGLIINELNFSFWCFLIDIMKNQTMSFVETIKIKNGGDHIHLSNRDSQNLETIYGHAIKTFGSFQDRINIKEKTYQIQLLDTAFFDEALTKAQILYYECLLEYQQLLIFLQNDYLELIQLSQISFQVLRNRNKLILQLDELLSINPANPQLQILTDCFESSLSNRRILTQKYGHIISNPKQAINCSQLYEYSQETCVVFISLLTPIGKVIKVSQNFEKIVPILSNEESLGKNINFMIPPFISAVHDQILRGFIQKEQLFTGLADYPLLIGIDQYGWSLPYAMKFQVSQISDTEFGASSWIKQIKDKNMYMTVNGQAPNNIFVTAEKLFMLLFQDIFQKNEINKIYIGNILPMLGFISAQNPGELIETVILKPKSRSDTVNSHIDLTKKNNNIFIEMAKYDLFIIKAGFSPVANTYVSFIELQITEIHPVVSMTQLKDAIRLLSIQLIELAEKDRDTVQDQLDEFSEYFDLKGQITLTRIANSKRGSVANSSLHFQQQSELSEKYDKNMENSISLHFEKEEDNHQSKENILVLTEKSNVHFSSSNLEKNNVPSGILSKFHSEHHKMESQATFPTESLCFDNYLPQQPSLNHQIIGGVVKSGSNHQLNSVANLTSVSNLVTQANYGQNTSISEALNLISPRIQQGSASTREINVITMRDSNSDSPDNLNPKRDVFFPIKKQVIVSNKSAQRDSYHDDENHRNYQKSQTQVAEDTKGTILQKLNSQFKLFQNSSMQLKTKQDNGISEEGCYGFDDDQGLSYQSYSQKSKEQLDFFIQNKINNNNTDGKSNVKSKRFNNVKQQTKPHNQTQILVTAGSQNIVSLQDILTENNQKQILNNDKMHIRSAKKTIRNINNNNNTNKKTTQLQQQVENSIQSANTHKSSPRTQLLKSIHRRNRQLLLQMQTIFSGVFLLILLALNIEHFLSADAFLLEQKNDQLFSLYSDDLEEALNNMITDFTLELLADEGAILYKSNENITNLETLIDFEQTLSLDDLNQDYVDSVSYDPSVHNTFRVMNTYKQILYLLSDYAIKATPEFYTITATFSYTILIMLADIRNAVQQNIHLSYQQLTFIYQNQPSLADTFDAVGFDKNQKFTNSYASQKNGQVEQLIESVVISLIFSGIIGFVYYQIQFRRERILRLFSTISSEDIGHLLSDVNLSISKFQPFYEHLMERHRSLLEKNIENNLKSKQKQDFMSNNQNLKQQNFIFQSNFGKAKSNMNNVNIPELSSSSLRKRKRRTISATSSLQKISLKLVVSLSLAFVFLQCYSITNLITQEIFLNSVKTLREIKDILSVQKTSVSESLQFIISTMYIRMHLSEFDEAYQEFYSTEASDFIDETVTLFKELYDCLSQYQSIVSVPGLPNDSFPSDLLEVNACEAFKWHTELQTRSSSKLIASQCESYLVGSLQSGLITSLKLYFQNQREYLDITMAVDNIPDFLQSQKDLKSNIDIYEIYKYRRAGICMYQALLARCEDMIGTLFSVSLSLSTIVIYIQGIIIVVIIALSNKAVLGSIHSTLHSTQLLLDIIDIGALLNNSYAVSYFKTN